MLSNASPVGGRREMVLWVTKVDAKVAVLRIKYWLKRLGVSSNSAAIAKQACGNCMERKITQQDMISMSRSSRDNRASKIPKVTSDITANTPSTLASKKSQIRVSGISPRSSSTSKKATIADESLAGASSASKNPENGSTHANNTSNIALRVLSRSKRAYETSGNVTLDALRPVKKRKISKGTDGPSSSGQVKSPTSHLENGKHAAGTIDSPVVLSKAPPEIGLRNCSSAVESLDNISSQPGELGVLGSSSPPSVTRNGRSKVEKRKEQRALRPRPTATAPKVKKRTRFHEVTLGEGDWPRIVGRRIKVFWPLEDKYFYGHVKSFNGARKHQHKIVYDDKDEEWLRLQNEVFRIELLPGEVLGESAAAPSTESNSVVDVGVSPTEQRVDAANGVARERHDASPVETTHERRIKPDGVYRRKRRAETDEPVDESTVQEKEKGRGAQSKKKVKGDGEQNKHRVEKEFQKNGEPKKKYEGKRGGRKAVEVMTHQRGTLAERLGRMNAKRSSGNSVVRERRKTGVQVVTSRDLRMKGLTSEGSISRRKRAGKEKGSRGSSIQTRLRHSLSVEKESKKTLRRRIRDDDRLFSNVKSSNAVIKRKMAESKESKERITSGKIGDAKSGSRTRKPDRIVGALDIKLARRLSGATERKAAEEKSIFFQGSNVTGPYEAVMDAYREALSGIKESPSTRTVSAIEELCCPVAKDEGGTLPERNPFSLQNHDGEDLRPTLDEVTGLIGRASSRRPVLTSTNGEDAPVNITVNDDQHDVGIEADGIVIFRGKDVMDDQPISRAADVVEPQLSPAGTHLRLEVSSGWQASQLDKVYRRLKHSRNKVHSEGVDEQSQGSQTVVPVSQFWVLTRALPSVSHVLSSVARIAILGFFNRSFDRVAFSRLQGRSCTEGGRFQLSTFYGEPGMLSLLRVSRNSLEWFFAATSISLYAIDETSSNEAIFSLGKITNSKLLNAISTNRRFKRRGIPSLEPSRHMVSLRMSMDPALDLKFLVNPYFRGLGGRTRLRYVFKRSLRNCVHSGALASVSQESYDIPSSHLRSSLGLIIVDLYTGGPVISSGRPMRVLFLSHSSMNRMVSPKNVSNGEVPETFSSVAGLVAPVVGFETKISQEVGAFYGRPSFQSFLKVMKADRRSIESLQRVRSLSSLDQVNMQREKGGMDAAGCGVRSMVCWGPTFPVIRDDNVLPFFSVNRDMVTVDESNIKTQETPFLGPWFIVSWMSRLLTAFSYLTIPRRCLRVLPGEWSTASLCDFSKMLQLEHFVLPAGSAVPRAPDCTAVVHHVDCQISQSVGIMHEQVCDAGENCFASCNETPNSLLKHPGSNSRQLGQHLGPPSVESMIRVSKDFWLWLLVRGRTPLEPDKNSPVAHAVISLRTLPQGDCRELSSIETAEDDDLSDQDDETQVMSGERIEADDSSAGLLQDPSVECSKAASISVRSVKKGRRTGKGLKRGFGQIGMDSLRKDCLGSCSLPDGEEMSGRLDSKRGRVEVESSSAEVNSVKGVHESALRSRLNGMAAPPLSDQERTKGSTLPRVNVLKLRRCPTNKGLWLVAGNSCITPHETGLRVAGVEANAGLSLDSVDIGLSRESSFETSRKRVFDQCMGLPCQDRNVHSEFPIVANTALSLDFQNGETTALGMKSAKALSLNSKSREVWVDCGNTSINGITGTLETRKPRRNGPSPPGDDVDGFAEQSTGRSAETGWGSCIANVLITKNDRCIRETGATVELQPGLGNSYLLIVSMHGEKRYALKAEQPVPSGTTNKFTHSMMWRGGKAWSLEFVDRKQWQLFKDLHEECFQKNARAASVRHIPIPGVKLIRESPNSGLRFVRSSLKYIRQCDGEVEMALSSTRIIYDMDSDDEDWLSQVNCEKVSARGLRSRFKINDETLEAVMDKLEKASFIQNQEHVSAKVASELCELLGSPDVIMEIYSYWQQKRQQKRMALVRHFQPAPWEQYQSQLQEWQTKIDLLQQQSPTASKQEMETLLKRPPLFAFCLRPRGLEGRNKMQKQRSQRKQGLGGSSSRQWTLAGPPTDFFLDSPSKRHTVSESHGVFSGSRKFNRQRSQEDNFAELMAVDLSGSFNARTIEGVVQEAVPQGAGADFPPVKGSPLLGSEVLVPRVFKRTKKKLGRKAKRMKLITTAEDSRLKMNQALQGYLSGALTVSDRSPQSPSDSTPTTPGIIFTEEDGLEEDPVALFKAAEADSKAKREVAISLRSRAQALYAVADAAMHKAVAAVIAADVIHAAEKTIDEGSERVEGSRGSGDQRMQTGEVPVSLKDASSRRWGQTEGSGGGPSFGSWRRALNSASKSANHVLANGSTNKPGMLADTDDPLLPVASWSQELGSGLGTRLLQMGDVSQKQRYSPVVVEGLSKSPTRGTRGESLVSLGRTRGESMVAMLTR